MQDHPNRHSEIEDILKAHALMSGNLLPILHAIQDRFGFIPEDAIAQIAVALNRSKAEVHGVISFYHYFRRTPPGKNIIRICRAESCQAMQGRELEKYARKKLNIDWHGTTRDDLFSLEPVYCLGNCACSPAITVNNAVYGRVTPERFDEIIAEYRGGLE